MRKLLLAFLLLSVYTSFSQRTIIYCGQLIDVKNGPGLKPDEYRGRGQPDYGSAKRIYHRRYSR